MLIKPLTNSLKKAKVSHFFSEVSHLYYPSQASESLLQADSARKWLFDVFRGLRENEKTL